MEPKLSTSDVHLPYLAGCQRGELVFSRCGACQHAQLAAYRVCVACGSPELITEVSSGKGAIASFTVVHRAPSEFFKAQTPYTLALIDFDEGFRAMMSVSGRDQPAIGDRVKVDFSARGPAGEPLPHARIEGDGR